MYMSEFSGKYAKLTDYLLTEETGTWQASFEEIEDILGSPLPKSARTHKAWWANQGKAQSLAWMKANRRTRGIDLKEETVTFEYFNDKMKSSVREFWDDVRRNRNLARTIAENTRQEPLTIEEAKTRLAATFGVEPSQIEITIKL